MPGYRCCRRGPTSDLCAFCGGQQDNVYTAVFHDMAAGSCVGDCTDINTPESFSFSPSTRVGECERHASWGILPCGADLIILLVWWKDGDDYKVTIELLIPQAGVPAQFIEFSHNFGASKPACGGYVDLRCDFVTSDGTALCDASSAYVLLTASNP
jgi:hypothetical protein